MEYNRVLELEWQSDGEFWNKPGSLTNRNHLLDWLERVPGDPTEYHPYETPPINEAIVEYLLTTFRERKPVSPPMRIRDQSDYRSEDARRFLDSMVQQESVNKSDQLRPS
eukprot:6597375-Heterocapsa_arctica.AAC.1